VHITSIRAYRVIQPFLAGPYKMSKGRQADHFDSLIVSVTADSGLTGWGEMAPLGNFYAPAFAAGARAGIAEIAPHLLGEDPRALARINRKMDTVFKGHPYIKSAMDMACTDLAARAQSIPAVTLLGGQDGDSAELYTVVTHGPLDSMVASATRHIAAGYSRLQIKIGGDVHEDITRLAAIAAAIPKATVLFCDANAAWSVYQARQFTDATRNIDYTLEQPCRTIDDCLSIRKTFGKPLVLDESVTSLDDLLEIHRKGAADGVTLKISRLGGVSKTRLIRDVAGDLGLMITVEDTGGAEIDTAAMAHLSLSTPAELRLHAIAFHRWVTIQTAANAPPIENCQIFLPPGPGLGINVLPECLGPPFLDLQ